MRKKLEIFIALETKTDRHVFKLMREKMTDEWDMIENVESDEKQDSVWVMMVCALNTGAHTKNSPHW